MKLNKKSQKVLQQLITKYPQLREVAIKLNSFSVNWGIAAGTAYDIHFNKFDANIDDIDILIDSRDKTKVSEIFNIEWEPHSSERHKALNIKYGDFDFFTDCVKYKNGKEIFNYLWTESVTKHLYKADISGVSYKILSPEDVMILKKANPRDDNEVNQIKNLTKISNKDYLNLRSDECRVLNI
jgi:hypothetical protein